jgi:hypothetical protein
MNRRKSTKGQTTIYKTYNRVYMYVTRTPIKTGMISCAPEGLAVPVKLINLDLVSIFIVSP